MSKEYKIELLCNGKILQTYEYYDEAIAEMDSLYYEDSCTGIDDNVYTLNVEGDAFITYSDINRIFYEELGCEYSESYFDYEYACMLDKWNNVVVIFKKPT